ncbi:MAG: glutamine-hydrolyzing GMP synthase [Patescibacteria group bacterium]
MDKIAVLDFGGQYAHLIANRVRRLGVYSEILEGSIDAKNLSDYKGLILSGGPASVLALDSLKCDQNIFNLGIPILGICYGHQLAAAILGGEVDKGVTREYGSANVKFLERKSIFEGVDEYEPVWMSHFDQVIKAPEGFEVVAATEDCPISAMADYKRNIFCVQFHPEVTHTPCGNTILGNFVNLTNAKHEWDISSYIDNIVGEIKQKVGDKKVFLMISGGVDSTVAFLLLDKALGQDKVYGLFVDTGFMRLGEREEVEKALKELGVTNLHVYDGGKEYFEALKNVYEPEQKRKIMGNLFLDIQEKVSGKLNLNPNEWMLGQGTIYPDTIETAGTKHADKIKTHHNQVDRVKQLTKEGKVIEPLSQLYKDEVRKVGEKLGLPTVAVWRHPFPGPGLAVRVLCAEKADYPQNSADLEKKLSEVVLNYGCKVKVLPIKSVGVQGDERTYKHPAVIFGKQISWEDANKLSTQLTNRFPEINRVLLGLMPASFDELDIQKAYLTSERISLLQKADKIVMDYIKEVGIDKDIWQFPTVLIPVCVNGSTAESLVLRPVCSQEAMTANFYQMDFDNLDELVKKLSALKEIGAIFYDITNKPPGTIEWE